jgi:acyl carrier protein
MVDAKRRAQKLIAEAMHMDVAILPEDASIETLPHWDSLNHMRVILRLEGELDRSMSSEEMLSIVDVDSVAKILAGNGKPA